MIARLFSLMWAVRCGTVEVILVPVPRRGSDGQAAWHFWGVGQESSAGLLVQALSLSSCDIVVGAQGAMPVSERLAYVAASFQNADGGVQAGVAAMTMGVGECAAERALAEPVARTRNSSSPWNSLERVREATWGWSAFRRNAATVDAVLVAWLGSRSSLSWEESLSTFHEVCYAGSIQVALDAPMEEGLTESDWCLDFWEGGAII